MIKCMGFGNLFDGIFSSAYIGYKKPSKEFYEKIFFEISHEGLLKEDIFYIDDEERNIIAGKEFGFNSFHYKNFKELELEIKK
jgi:putative hydrolase of the HAD superfamily